MARMHRSAIPAMIILVCTILPILGKGSEAEEGPGLFEPTDIGVEVLLNGPNLSFDLSVLDGLIKSNEVTILVNPGQMPVYGQGLDLPASDIYLMRSSYDTDLGVVIVREDLTEFLASQGYDVPMKGISVSILSPGEPVMGERNVTNFTLLLNMTGHLDTDLFGDLIELGFTDIRTIGGPVYSHMEFRSGGTVIRLTGEDANEGNGTPVLLEVEMVQGAHDELLEGMIKSLLELLGNPPSLWEEAIRTDFTLSHTLVRTDPSFDPATVDWRSAMRSQLDYLVSIGVISGLGVDDIGSIAQLCRKGAFGSDSRIFFDHRKDNWTYYNSTGLPTPVGTVFGPGPVYGESDFPERPATDGDHPGTLYVLAGTAVGVFVSVLVGSVLYQRIDRTVKLNNARRVLIYELIKQRPGIHFSALMKELGLKPGVSSYHINRLEKEEMIKSFQDGMYRRFYLFDDKVEMRIRLSDLQKLIVETIKDEPGISQIEISKLIGRSKVVINYHVRFLRDLGILVLEAEGRETHCYLTPQGTRLSSA